MASDIVNRLRRYRPNDEWGLPGQHTICDEAADHIEVLEAEVADEITALRERCAELEAAQVPDELTKLTFAVQHNPNCPSPWLVRLPGNGPIDMLPYGDPLGLVRHQTGDILGFGKTFGEAARAALSTAPESKP